MARAIGGHPGFYTGLSSVISRLPGEITTAFSGAAGVVNAFLLKEKFDLAVEDPEKYKERYPAEFKDE